MAKGLGLKILAVSILFFSFFPLSAQEDDELISLDFRNQKIADILISLAEMCNQSIIVDDTVIGSTTFHFHDKDFSTALNRFAEHCQLYVEEKDGIFHVSKIFMEITERGLSVNSEEVLVETFLLHLSRKTRMTIMHDSLPSVTVSIRANGASVKQILELVLTKINDYILLEQSGGFYIAKNNAQTTRNTDRVEIIRNNELFTMSLKKGTLASVVELLFKNAQKEYSLLTKISVNLENMFYENKSFDQLLRLILEQSGCDYTILNGVYYIFEIQKKDVYKKLKDTIAVTLSHVPVGDVNALFPAELNAGSLTRIDKNTNTIYVTGSNEEIEPILEFLAMVDVPMEGRYYARFDVSKITIQEAIALLPKSMLFTEAIAIPNTMSFVAQVTQEKEKEVRNYLAVIDQGSDSYPVYLNYIKSEDLMKHLPPSIKADNLVVSTDENLVFYKGSEKGYRNFLKDLNLIDQPKEQIRYQLLVIQYQKNDSLNYHSSLSFNNSNEASSTAYSGAVGNLINIQFDIISKFGLQFAAALNAELGSNRARILADTTLNGISGETISFQNTNTYRYRDIAIDASTGLYTGTTQEITSGLFLQISGWASGNDMITVNVEAQVSKQGGNSSVNTTDSLPTTSEKKVMTNVRAKSGEPVIIGGLLQTEIDEVDKKVPILGSIPLIGNLFRSKVSTTIETELVIYLVPFVEMKGNSSSEHDKQIRDFYQRYLGGVL